MGRFVIAPHMRLHEWVAEEKGYFADAGLDYEFRDELRSPSGRRHDLGDRVGVYQTIEKGRTSDVSCACHWTVNVAASVGHGRLYADCYSVAPAGIFVPADSPITTPEQLAGVPISVGFQSGSHYSTIQALEQYMPMADIALSFADGLLFRRMEKLIDGEVPAVSLFSGPYYFAEQLGFRKVIDTTFMMASMITGELYTKHYRREFPERFHAVMDTRRWGPGERLVFEPYTRDVFEQAFNWIAEREIFAPGEMGAGRYESAVMSLAPG